MIYDATDEYNITYCPDIAFFILKKQDFISFFILFLFFFLIIIFISMHNEDIFTFNK